MSAAGQDIERDRAAATLYGLALGDALGMPSQTLTREEIRRNYGTIEGFVAPFAGHPVSDGLDAAQVTDDTEQTVLLARRLIDCPGAFDAKGWTEDLLEWEAGVKARGLLDLLGPSSKAALEAIRHGANPAEAGKSGTTNGAAMRIAPVGIMVPAEDIDALVAAVEETCRVTHNTGEAIAAAAAVAGYISARVWGASDSAAFETAIRAAELGQKRGHTAGIGDMAERIAHAVKLAGAGVPVDVFAESVGTSVVSHEAVPAAFGLMRMAAGDVWRAGLLAANIGDDTDTIGAMACAMCASGCGMDGLPQEHLERLKSANALEIEDISEGLIALRRRAPVHSREVVS
ncbi:MULTISPECIES: ADP-ribosylglycohydrolase family protein [unclassified Ruegeria]|uniref:ADP-ribosylglycohydrolase family protein n=1 Tax=unclassified Ruegeria TaxID=2625375 RepID=UPI0014888157|nr:MULTISPECIES: ADP-ribosylglycohydrolase family protein [unclassified Ruegeria]